MSDKIFKKLKFRGKHNNLLDLKNEGFNIPPFFVIKKYQNFTERDIFKKYHEHIKKGAVAIRSSSSYEDGLTQSNAGKYTTRTDIDIKEAFSVIDSVRNYECEKIDIFIQEYIEADISGVAFTINPLNGKNEIFLNYVKGACEQVVSGLGKPKERILSKVLNENSDDVFDRLTFDLIKIELLYGFPVDIEWCIKDDIIYILQCRPVTVITDKFFSYKWSANEPLWAMELAHKVRTGKIKYEGFHPYITQDLIYKGSEDKVSCFNSNSEFVNAMDYIEYIYDNIDKIKPIKCNFSDNLSIRDKVKEIVQCYCFNINTYILTGSVFMGILENVCIIKYGKDYINELLSSLPDVITDEQNDFIRIKKNDFDGIKSHLEKYKYLSLGFSDNNKAIQHLNAMIDNTNTNTNTDFDNKHFKLNNKFYDIDDIELKTFLSLSTLRMKVKMEWAACYYFINDLMSTLVDDMKLNDIFSELNFKIELNENHIDKKEFILGSLDGKILEESSTNRNELKVMGRAFLCDDIEGEVVILNNSEVYDYNDLVGKIIVTDMIQPQVIPIVRNCLGLITDEGGILSHAAIVSREHNIGSIIGCSCATSILKNGDKVKMHMDGSIEKVQTS